MQHLEQKNFKTLLTDRSVEFIINQNSVPGKCYLQQLASR